MRRFLTLFVTFCLLNSCDLGNTPNGNFIPLQGNTPPPKFPSLVIPNDFSPTPLTEDEIESLRHTINAKHRKGHDLIESKKIQIEGLVELISIFNNVSEEEMKFLGPIEGYILGMTIEEYADQVIQQMIEEAKEFPLPVQREFRYEIVSWIYTLQTIKSECTPSTNEECILMSNLSDKYLFLREKIIEAIEKKMKLQLGL